MMPQPGGAASLPDSVTLILSYSSCTEWVCFMCNFVPEGAESGAVARLAPCCIYHTYCSCRAETRIPETRIPETRIAETRITDQRSVQPVSCGLSSQSEMRLHSATKQKKT